MVQLSAFIGTFALALSAVHAAPNLSLRQSIPDPAGEKNIGNGAGIQFIGGQCLGAADCASGCCATLPRGGETIGVCSGIGAQTQAGKQGCGFESGAGNQNNNQGGNNDNTGGAIDNGNGSGTVDNGNSNGNNNNNNNNGNGNGNDNGNDNGNNGGNFDNGNNANVNDGSNQAGGTVQPSTLQPDPAGANNVGNGQGDQFIGGECTSDADCASTCCALVNTGDATFGICSGLGANTQNGKQGCGFPAGGQQIAGSA